MRQLSKRIGPAICLALTLMAQAPVPKADSSPNDSSAKKAEGPATFTADTRLVVLPVSVSDKSGKLVTNLARQSFKVYENGAEQAIKIFRREDVPSR